MQALVVDSDKGTAERGDECQPTGLVLVMHKRQLTLSSAHNPNKCCGSAELQEALVGLPKERPHAWSTRQQNWVWRDRSAGWAKSLCCLGSRCIRSDAAAPASVKGPLLCVLPPPVP